MGKITVVLGSQWGDEGKGKWVDHLAESSHMVARFQGGNNAGHTLSIDGQKIVLHQLPSGVCHPEKIAALLAGVVLDPVALQLECKAIAGIAEVSPHTLWISPRAHVITPFHIFCDGQLEAQRHHPIGTTKRGIGPTYSSKYNRTGLRVGDYIDRERFSLWCAFMRHTFPEFVRSQQRDPQAWERFTAAAESVRPFVNEAEAQIRLNLHDGATLLLEGAQGSLLDIDHGTYPYVTSSSTIAAAAAVSLGIDPRKISAIYGIAKAYATRVGQGAFPSELDDQIGNTLVHKGNEYGATTRRRRRCGWFDAVAMRYAAALNGFDALFLNKIDILSDISPLKIAVGYRDEHGTLRREFPTAHHQLDSCTAFYEEYEGWTEDISGIRSKKELPRAARDFVDAIALHSGVPVKMLGTGPGREDYIEW